MIPFAWNVMLAIAWAALTGEFSGLNLLVGFILGYLALCLAQAQIPGFEGYGWRVPRLIGFVFFFFWEMVKANARVAYDVITPTYYMRPGVVGIPLEAETDAEITILANLISLTPGTLSLDVSDDHRVLYIHAMYLDDEEELMASIKELERRVLRIMR